MSESTLSGDTPSRDASVTARCRLCGVPVPPGRPRLFCSPAHRQTAYRRRHQSPAVEYALPAARSRRAGTVYACPMCDERYVGVQHCPECNTFCVREGPGGRCPHCDEPLTVAELLATLGDG